MSVILQNFLAIGQTFPGIGAYDDFRYFQNGERLPPVNRTLYWDENLTDVTLKLL